MKKRKAAFSFYQIVPFHGKLQITNIWLPNPNCLISDKWQIHANFHWHINESITCIFKGAFIGLNDQRREIEMATISSPFLQHLMADRASKPGGRKVASQQKECRSYSHEKKLNTRRIISHFQRPKIPDRLIICSSAFFWEIRIIKRNKVVWIKLRKYMGDHWCASTKTNHPSPNAV